MQFARRHHYRPPKRAVRRRQKRRFIPTVTTPTGENLDGLLCMNFSQESDFTFFIENFNTLIAIPANLTAAQLNTIDYYNDGVVGFDDRDYWLDQLIRRNITVTSRLPYGVATPTTYAESDPLGLRFQTDGVTLRPNVIFIDSLNTSKVYVLESSNNRCYTDEARTILNPTHNLLFDGTTGSYNTTNMVWGDIRSLSETPNTTSHRFPNSDVACTVYIRGGSYTLDREITIVKQSGFPINPAKIDIRAYPGETVHIYCGNQFIDPSYDNDVMVTLSRPDLHIDDSVIFHGFRVDGSGNRIFAAGVLSVTNAADRFRFTGTVRDFRAIASDHPDAGRLPKYVDYAFYNRTGLPAGDSTGKMLTTTGVLIGEGNAGTLIYGATFHPADDDIPPAVSVPGGATEESYGDTMDVAGATDLTIRHNTFSGTSSHSALRIRESGSVTPSNVTIEYNDMRNPENNVLLISNCVDSTIRYNRIHDFSNRGDLAGNDGYGIQVADGQNLQITDNVVWLGNKQGSGPNYGIQIGVSQSDVTTEFTDSTVARNILYQCGMFMGYSSGTPSSDLGRITGNTIEDNIIEGLSDYNATQATSDGNIVLNLGPHSATAYTNVIQDNIIFGMGTGHTAVVERLYPSTYSDWTISDHESWFLSNDYSNSMFVDPDNGDFTLQGGSLASAVISANTPVHPDDLEIPFAYTCPTGFSTATFSYRQRYYQGWLDLNMPPLAKQLIGGTP